MGRRALGSLPAAFREAETQCRPPTGPAAYMLPVVLGPHTVSKASQPSFSIKGRSKLGSFGDDLHKVRGAQPGCSVCPTKTLTCPSPQNPQPDPTLAPQGLVLKVATCPGLHSNARRVEQGRGSGALLRERAAVLHGAPAEARRGEASCEVSGEDSTCRQSQCLGQGGHVPGSLKSSIQPSPRLAVRPLGSVPAARSLCHSQKG